ncbi:MAG: tripartite tricarboxylate transporter substrate binding protein [Hyphomicrobiales bacterium]|nr:tripartite tricarboxylate transporter substrate binding protein [Hyphomicrobiales bacterium]
MAAATAPASAQWPTRPVTIVIPFTPGTTVDISARVVMEQAARQTGQPVVIENRGGAGGTIGTNAVATAAPDGHTLLVTGSLASAHALYANLPYDALRDFIPVISLGLQPLVLISGPGKGFKSPGDLIAAGKARPGALNYASAGVGSASHLAAERFRMAAGFEGQHVPFRGSNEALTELMAGRIDFYVAPIPSILPLIKEGKVVALAVSATHRAAVLPEVPTTVEAGLVDSVYSLYAGVYAPARTPADVVRRIFAETEKALTTPSVQDRLKTAGAEPMTMSQEQFERFYRDDVDANVKLARSAKIPMQQ